MMFDFSFLDINYMKTFLLVFFRMTAFMLMLPFLGSKAIPARVKLALAVVLSFAAMPMIPTVHIEDTLLSYLFNISKEMLLGLIIGFCATMFFSVGHVAGFIIGMQIGIRMSDLVDPFTDASVSIIGELMFFAMSLILFASNLHLYLVKSMFDSFSYIPLTQLRITPEVPKIILDTFVYVFKVSVQLAAPVLFVSIIINVSKGLIARTAPGINILMLGFPILILCGLFMLYATMPMSFALMRNILGVMVRDIYSLLRIM